MRSCVHLGFAGFIAAGVGGMESRAHTTIPAPPAFAGQGPQQRHTSLLEVASHHPRVRDVADEQLDSFSFVRACLTAGDDSTPNDAEHDLTLWRSHKQAILQQVQSPAELFERMHASLLRRYVRDADTLQSVLRTGEFNCMSASIVFLALCQEAGFPAHARTTRGHVRIHVEEFPEHDIETTSATWQGALVRQADEAPGVPPWRSLNSPQLIAKMYFNRATRAIHASQWARAVELAGVACQLDPLDPSAAANRTAAYNSWAKEAAQRGDLPQARSLIEEALQWTPQDPALLLNRRLLLSQ